MVADVMFSIHSFSSILVGIEFKDVKKLKLLVRFGSTFCQVANPTEYLVLACLKRRKFFIKSGTGRNFGNTC